MVTEAKFLKLKTELDKYRTTTQTLVLELSKLMKEMNEREASRTASSGTGFDVSPPLDFGGKVSVRALVDELEEEQRPFVSEGPVPVTDSTPATADTSPPIADDEVLS